MKGRFLQMKMHNFVLIHILLFITIGISSVNPWPFLLLTIAQLIYVPITLRLIMNENNWFSKNYLLFAIPTYIAVAFLQILPSKWDGLFAGIYLIFTMIIALYGLTRFLKRGFTNFEEFAIDSGLVYLALGGIWFFAYKTEFNTGFSPLITWLTAIHFHYSAFLLPIFIGLLGRLYQSTFYKIICAILIISPMVVAIGITFSPWIELLSVMLYIFGLYGLIFLVWKTSFQIPLQKWLVRMSFAALGVTIVFSLLYALGTGFGLGALSINFMLLFHGLLNCILFAMAGLIGWAISVPSTTFQPPTFPSSKIRGRFAHGNNPANLGLVDSMKIFEPQLNCSTLAPTVIDFYENTTDYRLFATVKWHTWFKPFAFVYKLLSRKIAQINLPLHQKQVEMTGAIYPVTHEQDGRENVRAWVRNIQQETVFIALYSTHKNNGRNYMNIALPLPFSSMFGILELNQIDNELQLTSKKLSSPMSDAGIYLAIKKLILKLPIEEDFIVRERSDGSLIAKHKMWVFSIPFLTINYEIHHKHANMEAN